jgi:hypothetical protein
MISGFLLWVYKFILSILILISVSEITLLLCKAVSTRFVQFSAGTCIVIQIYLTFARTVLKSLLRCNISYGVSSEHFSAEFGLVFLEFLY